MDNQKKISLVEALLMVLLSLFVDGIDILFSFIALTGIGMGVLIILPFVDGAFFAIIEFWLIMRGGFGFRQQVSVIVGNLLDMIWFLNLLPFKTVSTMIAIYMINHPNVAQMIPVGTGNLMAKVASAAAAAE